MTVAPEDWFELDLAEEKTPWIDLKRGRKQGRQALTIPSVNSAWVQILAGVSSPIGTVIVSFGFTGKDEEWQG